MSKLPEYGIRDLLLEESDGYQIMDKLMMAPRNSMDKQHQQMLELEQLFNRFPRVLMTRLEQQQQPMFREDGVDHGPLPPHPFPPNVLTKCLGPQGRRRKGKFTISVGDFLKAMGTLPSLEGYPVGDGNLNRQEIQCVQKALYIAANYYRLTGRRFPSGTCKDLGSRGNKAWRHILNKHATKIGPAGLSMYGLPAAEAESFYEASKYTYEKRQADKTRNSWKIS